MRLNFWKVIFRAWFYFRQGYNLYLSFLIGFASNLVVLYRLGIQGNHYFDWFFVSLSTFALVGVLIAVPLGILAGLYHMKRTGAFAADASVATESNPYIYKIVPGKEQEVFLPLWVLTLRSMTKMLDQQKAVSVEEKKELEELIRKANALLDGQYVGLPQSLGVKPFQVTQGDK